MGLLVYRVTAEFRKYDTTIVYNFDWTPKRRNGIILNKYLISSSGDRTHKQSRLQSHFVPMRHAWPRELDYSFMKIV